MTNNYPEEWPLQAQLASSNAAESFYTLQSKADALHLGRISFGLHTKEQM